MKNTIFLLLIKLQFVLVLCIGWWSPVHAGDVDAALTIKKQTYLFKGNVYYRYSHRNSRVRPNAKPRELPGGWKGLPDSFLYGINAAMYVPESGKTYMFRGDTYIRLSGVTVDQAYRVPRKLIDGWKDLPAEFSRGIDAAVFRAGHAYFFKGDRYIRMTGTKVDPGYKTPKKMPGGWELSEFRSGVDAATATSTKSRVYFFKEGNYTRLIDIKADKKASYPKDIRKGWKGIPEAPLSLFQQEMTSIKLVNGQPMAFRLKPNTNLDADQLFTRYASEFGLNSGDQVQRSVQTQGGPDLSYKSYRQLHRGVPVLGVGYSVAEVNGRAISAVGKIASDLNIDVVPSISEVEALDSAMAALGAKQFTWELATGASAVPKAMLAISSVNYSMKAEDYRLVYRFVLNSINPLDSSVVDIDAHTGELVGKFSGIQRAAILSEGDTLFNGHQSFTADIVEDSGETYYRLSVQKGDKRPPSRTVYSTGVNPATDVEDVVSTSNSFNSFPLEADSGTSLGVSLEPLIFATTIHWSIQQVEDYWNSWNWTGVDGKGKQLITSIVDQNHLFCWGANACYLNDQDKFVFKYNSSTSSQQDGMTLSAVGHEYTHAIYEHAVRARGDRVQYARETSIINEGLADLFGWLVYGNKNVPRCTDYVPAHQLEYLNFAGNSVENCNENKNTCLVQQPAKCLGSDHTNPIASKRPVLYQGVNYQPFTAHDFHHHNASIIPYWFYRLTTGVPTNSYNELGNRVGFPGIDLKRAEKIVVHSLLHMLSGSADFEELREVTINVAKNLYGEKSQEAISVTKAWYLVGVGSNYDERSFLPANDAVDIEPWSAKLSWASLPGENEADIQISTDPLFKNGVISLSMTSSEIRTTGISSRSIWGATTVNLSPFTDYYWRVRMNRLAAAADAKPKLDKLAVKKPLPSVLKPDSSPNRKKKTARKSPKARVRPNENKWGEWSAVHRFMTSSKDPSLLNPSSGGKKQHYPWPMSFSWKPLSGASEYRLTVSTDSDKLCNHNVDNQVNHHTVVASIAAQSRGSEPESYEVNLKAGQKYHWWLQVIGPEKIAGGCANEGKPVVFETEAPKAKLLLPENDATVSPFLVPLRWSQNKGAESYALFVNEASGPSTPFQRVSENEKDISVRAGGKHQWSVSPIGPLGDIGDRSETWTFNADLELTTPTITSPKEGGRVSSAGHYIIWRSVDSADFYRVRHFKRDPDGGPGEQLFEIDTNVAEPCDASDPSNSCLYVSQTSHESGYCVQVQAVGPQGLVGNSSDLVCYKLSADSVKQLKPEDGATNVDYEPTRFSWESKHSPRGYKIKIKEAPDNECGLHDDGWQTVGSPKSGEFERVLQPNTNYCWWIININPDGSDGPGSISRFKTKKKPKPKPGCELSTALSSPPAVSITHPPSYESGRFASNPIFVVWNVKDQRIFKYKIEVGFIPVLGLTTWVDMPDRTQEFFASEVSNQNAQRGLGLFADGSYNIRLLGRAAGDNCPWLVLGGVTFTVK